MKISYSLYGVLKDTQDKVRTFSPSTDYGPVKTAIKNGYMVEQCGELKLTEKAVKVLAKPQELYNHHK